MMLKNNKWLTRILSAGMIAGACTAASAGSVETDGCTLRVFFPNDVSATTSQQNAQIVDFVKGSSSDVIAVRGFASNVGATGYNANLSKRRANRVGRVVSTAGYSFQPVAWGEAGATAYARRAEIYRDKCAVAILPAGAVTAGTTATTTTAGLGGLAGAGPAIAVIVGVAAVAAASGGSSNGTN
jgi:hypothetical protein